MKNWPAPLGANVAHVQAKIDELMKDAGPAEKWELRAAQDHLDAVACLVNPAKHGPRHVERAAHFVGRVSGLTITV